MQLSVKDRLVLCVLRHANQVEQSVSSISRLTELDRPTVELILRRLLRLILCDRGSVEGETRYSAVGLSDKPIVQEPLQWLNDFWSQPIEVDEGDFRTATYEVSGTVLLAALVMGTRDPAVIVGITELPPDFVMMIMELCHRLDLWWSPYLFELERTIVADGTDLARVSNALSDVKEEFWWAFRSPSVDELLCRARANQRCGGERDPWATVMEQEELESSAKVHMRVN